MQNYTPTQQPQAIEYNKTIVQNNTSTNTPAVQTSTPLKSILKTTDTSPLSTHNQTPYVVSYVGEGEEEKPIKGKAIFNSTLIEYLCDSGAAKTIITEQLWKRLQNVSQCESMTAYWGNPLRSCTGPIRVVGVLKIDTCIF
jgi:hypothetical protein